VLSVKKVAKLKAKGRYYDSGPGGVKGLCLQISESGAKSWLQRYQLNKRQGWMGHGSVLVVPLAQARERARAARLLLLDGIDPIEHRRAERSKQAQAMARALPFREAAQRYWEANSSGWSNRKHAKQFVSTLAQHAYPIIGNLDVAVIGTVDILKVLERRVDAERGLPAGRFWDVRSRTADRTRRRIASVLDWATVRGHRPAGLPNPARWAGHLDQVLPAPGDVAKTKNHRALPHARVPELMAKLAADRSIAARALMFTVCNAARSNETLGATWSEFDLQAKIWRIPAHRMKARTLHEVPLADAVVALLKGLPREGGDAGFVFPGGREGAPLSVTAMAQLLRRLGYGPEVTTVHGLRSSFRDWCAEQTNFPRELAEHALAHTVGDESERAYARSRLLERRRKLMESWCRYACAPPLAKASGKILPLQAAR
jgi:integrase